MVRTKYHLDETLLPSDPVLLTYEFPDLSRDPTSYMSPPVEMKEGGDVELFMSVRIEYAWLELYVTFGERDVGSYRLQRNEEDGITMGVADRSEISLMEVEDYRERGFILVSEHVLHEICTPDELEKIRRASYALAQNIPPPPIVVSDDDDSSEDSSSPRPSSVQRMPSIGVISLQDGASPEWLPPDNGAVFGKNPTVQNAMLYGEGGSNQDGNGFGDQHEPALTQMGMLSIRKNLDWLDPNLQTEMDRKGKGISEETPIIRNLAKEFDNFTGEPHNTKGRGNTNNPESG
ncbi:hypothetical protein Bca4012_009357 [Brassica carinata]